MNTFEVLLNATSVEPIVDFINTVNGRKDYLVDHYGWGDVASKYTLSDYAAAQYAWQALDEEDRSVDRLDMSLSFLRTEGAKFNKVAALEIAKLFLEKNK